MRWHLSRRLRLDNRTPDFGSFLTANRVFEEHLRLRDTSDALALDLGRVSIGLTSRS
jgi:hypothetical protein